MNLARLTLDYKGDKVVVTLKMAKPKGYYIFSFKRDKELVTITKPYPDLVNALDEVDIRGFKNGMWEINGRCVGVDGGGI